jgi:hypothetical protein
MGRTRATLAQRTCVKAWAESTVFLGGGRNKKYLNFFAGSGSAATPTTFHSCLTKGIPAPRLRHPNGEEGPALRIERHVPGSLKWLIHPLWSTFDAPCESAFEIHRVMAALPDGVMDQLFEPASPLLRRRSRALRPFCEVLFEMGTLDALAALLYCGYEAMLANDLAVARAVERTLRQRLMAWSGLQHLTENTKRCIEVLCRNAVDASSLVPLRKEEARWVVAAEIVSRRYRGVTQDDMVGSAEDIAHLEQVLKAP